MATLSSTPIVIDGKGHLLGRLAPPDARLYPPAFQGIANLCPIRPDPRFLPRLRDVSVCLTTPLSPRHDLHAVALPPTLCPFYTVTCSTLHRCPFCASPQPILRQIAAALPDAAAPVPPCAFNADVSAVFSILPQSTTSRWRPLELGQRIQRVYDETAQVSSRKSLPTAHRRVRGTVPHRTPSQCRRLHCMTVTAQYAPQTDFHAPPFRCTPSHDATMKSCRPNDHGLGRRAVLQGLHDSRGACFAFYFSYITHWILLFFFFAWKPSSYTAEKAGGRAKWVGVFEFPMRPSCAFLPPRRFEVLKHPFSRSPRTTASTYSQPHPFCVDENPRLAACTAWDCLLALRTHIASTSGIHESTPTAINTAFSIHGVVPATRLSLITRSHNRRSSFYTSSSAIVRAVTHTPP
ncbi:hypothetical protein C8J57DRAFT_1599241 [Mycena rebaudengoi]|nr:hypothetical protein C8J57DRAFT_1599241 [Mycena rebaudengoi]